MKILITGTAGFIFSNFVLYAQQETDWDIVGIDNLTYAGSLHNAPQNKRYKLYIGDVSNYQFVSTIFAIEKPDIVIHGAAQSHVDNSIKNSMDFVSSNVVGTHSMLEASLKIHTPQKFIYISCYDQQTRAFTKDGLKYYNELKIGDVVFTINPENNKLEEQIIENIIIQDYNGDMVRFNKPGIDMLLTPNHRVYDSSMNVVEAQECFKKEKIYFPKPSSWEGIKNNPILINNEEQNLQDLFYLIGVFLGDGFTAYQEKYIETKSGLSKNDFMQKARNSKTGRFTKINKTSDYRSLSKSWRIFFDIPENDKARQKTEKALFNLNIKYTKQSGESGQHLYFTSEPWVHFFNQFGKGAKNKFIPNWVLEYNTELLKELFNGLIDSDGCYSGNRRSFTTTSVKLKDGICELATKIGLNYNVDRRYTKNIYKGRVIEGFSWNIFFSERNKIITQNYITKEQYNGKIWCIKVKNKNFLVERNGRYIFSGNTDEVYGSTLDKSFTEQDVLNPRNPYSATKASGDLLAQSYYHTYGLPVMITRCSNNFGPRQHLEKFIPKAIINILLNKKVPLYGNGSNRREWTYTKDNYYAL
ncbi:MAG TPA: GDP-mannose 4,6-dehydratase, partial [Nitrososphaeraceae archaeon]|nr:GDP-mannose 4,6-dehydratase [Nitrososphaeraceae archaeon]